MGDFGQKWAILAVFGEKIYHQTNNSFLVYASGDILVLGLMRVVIYWFRRIWGREGWREE